VSARALVAVALGLTFAGPVLASDVGYIYGRVETDNGQKYVGQLRWGDEESFWDDLFNANKAENDNLADLDPRVVDDIKDRHWHGWDVFGGNEPDLTHVFAIRFGDLKRLEVHSRGNVVAEFRNGEELQLKGGSNDVGAVVTVMGKQGKREIPWDRIRTIEFMDTPAALGYKLGEPIYGTVKSGRYDFTGRIQWDNDETLTTDKLDGETSDGNAHLEFGEIASIRKHKSGALVTLRSGDEMYLRGTNDEQLGKELLEAMVFEGHPYGSPSLGSERGLTTATHLDAKKHWARVLCARRVRVALRPRAQGMEAAWRRRHDRLHGASRDRDREYGVP